MLRLVIDIFVAVEFGFEAKRQSVEPVQNQSADQFVLVEIFIGAALHAVHHKDFTRFTRIDGHNDSLPMSAIRVM